MNASARAPPEISSFFESYVLAIEPTFSTWFVLNVPTCGEDIWWLGPMRKESHPRSNEWKRELIVFEIQYTNTGSFLRVHTRLMDMLRHESEEELSETEDLS